MTVHEYPVGRIGGLAVTASAHVALGRRHEEHDLSPCTGHRVPAAADTSSPCR
ncbi:hypothetical protein ACIO87_30400 [Streptomyces sp. NPDC087218]|uniref:hypothetical protein n=1 Tax=Streptomyces sp. NPDC087218 TaxID=3365769 RepID=UPI003827A51C